MCPNCEECLEYTGEVETDISSEWIEVMVTCTNCGTILVGWMQIEHMDTEKDA